jgi:hypothetical protein
MSGGGAGESGRPLPLCRLGFIQGEGRMQGTLFPVTLEKLIPEDHVCRSASWLSTGIALPHKLRVNAIADSGRG